MSNLESFWLTGIVYLSLRKVSNLLQCPKILEFQSSSALARMSAASSALSTLHRLHEAREEGDYTLSCRGTTLRAHSYILAAR